MVADMGMAETSLAELADRPVCAASLVAVHETDVTALSAADQLYFARLCQRVEAHAAARRIEAVSAFAGREPARSDPACDLLALELAVALRLAPGAAVNEVHRDRLILATLPGTLLALRRGELGMAHVHRMLEATVGATSVARCAAVEARVLPRAGSQTAAELGRCARRAVAALDPDGFERAHKAAAASVDVTLNPVADAMAYLTAYLSVSDAAAVMRTVEADARTAKAAGDSRPLGVLRGEAFCAAFTSTGHTEHGRGQTTHGRPAVELHVVATVETVLGLSQTPGEIPGVSPVPATVIREMARDAALRLLTIDSVTGRLVDYGARTYRVPTAMAARVNAEWVTSAGPGSTVDATRCDLDHLTPYPRGVTSPDNLAPVDRRWHRAKTLTGVTVRRRPDGSLEWTTPLGQSITVQPYDYRLGP
jgi:hypothetical protein